MGVTRVFPGAFVFVVILAFLVAACGLPTTPYLAPPINPDYSGPIDNAQLLFSHNPENDVDDFDGYDIWYKLYPVTAAGEDASDNDEQAIDVTPRQPGVGRLQARGFRKAIALVRDNGESSPRIIRLEQPQIDLAPTSTSIQFVLDLRFPGTRPSEPAVTDAEITIARNLEGSPVIAGLRRRNSTSSSTTNPEQLFHSFWNPATYDNDDLDVYDQLLTQSAQDNPDDMYIVLYVITVGLDHRTGATFNRFYSEPLRLERVKITFS